MGITYSDAEVGLMCVGSVVGFVLLVVYKVKKQDAADERKKKIRAEKELRRKKAEQEALEIYEAARLDYELALDNLEREDSNQNRIAALEKGRTLCATYRELAHGEAAVTAVDEQSITNDINARTCD